MRYFKIENDEQRREVADYLSGANEQDAAQQGIQDKIDATAAIVAGVKERGDAALAEYTERFDGLALKPEQFELSNVDIDAAVATVEPRLISILEQAHENIRRFHAKFLRESWEENLADGAVMGQRITPIDRAGVYVPGGTAFYPSSVLMNIAPAKVAGVQEVVMVSPPSYNGSIHPAVLAAARIAGADRIFRIGGAQAIAALAYGTETIPAVDKITGPGNTFVAAAKGLVRSRVDIDSEAGPSEVLVLADETAKAEHVMAEMLAQAEHDEDAMSILVTPCESLAEAVRDQLPDAVLAQPRANIIQASLDDHGVIIVTRDMEEAIALSDIVAPEHLSIQVEFPHRISDKIKHAGAMMLGAMTPVAVGDYFAGPNHILPTGRKARFASPLTAEDFRKVSSIIYYSKERLLHDAEAIMTFAEVEGLHAHAHSIKVRT